MGNRISEFITPISENKTLELGEVSKISHCVEDSKCRKFRTGLKFEIFDALNSWHFFHTLENRHFSTRSIVTTLKKWKIRCDELKRQTCQYLNQKTVLVSCT